MTSLVVKAFFLAFVVVSVAQGLLFSGDKDKEPQGPPLPHEPRLRPRPKVPENLALSLAPRPPFQKTSPSPSPRPGEGEGEGEVWERGEGEVETLIKGRIESLSPESKKFAATASSHIRNAKLNYAKLPANIKQELKATFPLTTALSENPIVDQTVNKLFVK